ncbi:MAG: flagellar filament capping protein FliD, partial [Gammaproteobacteria bacterium]|nr:flagellar filament capping protein FliD [Gammaproteobacteria bacterium]
LSRREATFQAELSGLGTFRAALDSFRSALEPLKNLQEFSSRSASSSDEEVFTVTADNDVPPGRYDLEVISLANAQKLSSTAFADADTFIGTGTLDITIGSRSMSVDIDLEDEGDGTLRDIRDTINSADNNPGIVAGIVNADDGAYLVLTGTKTGAENTITVTASGGDGGLSAFDYDPPGTSNMTELQAASDAEILIDTFTHFSSTNVVSDVIEGLTLNLESAEPGSTATLTIELDKDNAKNLVEDFVSAYNALQSATRELTSYDAETQVAGLLQGDSIVPSLTNRLSAEFNKVFEGPLRSIRELGMSISLTGEIELDEEILTDVMRESFNEVGNLFADTSTGAAVRFDALMDEYLKADGLLDVRTDGLNSSIERINDDRESLNRHLIAVEERLRTQFLALDGLIAELNGTSGFLNSQLSNLIAPDVLL